MTEHVPEARLRLRRRVRVRARAGPRRPRRPAQSSRLTASSYAATEASANPWPARGVLGQRQHLGRADPCLLAFLEAGCRAAGSQRAHLGEQGLAGATAEKQQHVGIAVDLPGQLVEQRQGVHAGLGPRVAVARRVDVAGSGEQLGRRPRRRARRGLPGGRRPRGPRRTRSPGRPRARTSSSPRCRAGRPSPAPSAGPRCRGRRRPRPSPPARRSRRAGPTGRARGPRPGRRPRRSAPRRSARGRGPTRSSCAPPPRGRG